MDLRNILITLLVIAPAVSSAQSPVEYDIAFDNAVHHEARITVTWRDLGNEPLELRMSRSSPGRYAIHEFGKNIYNIWIVDGDGDQLEAARTDPYQWTVGNHDGTVSVTYTLYADRAGGTYSGVDMTHAHLNIPATLMWARGTEDRPAVVTFFPPTEDWQVATQLVPTEDPYVFTAPDLQYLLDSPTELSAFDLRSWEVDSGGRTQTIRLAVHHDGTAEDVDTFAEMAKKVVDAQIEIFGELPEFDYGTYTFIADYLPYVAGDGMEHRNSTILASTQSFVEAQFGQLGTLSHEFIHAWNVERIRPADLEPFDFERANMSGSLWFAEGFTSYYGELAIRRAGEQSTDDFADSLSYWVNTVTNSPGRNFATPTGMSMQAPFVDAASAIDPTNFSNTFISYYTYGAALALALDLAMRAEFDDLSLDSLMQAMWQKHGKTERPYTNDDIRITLAEVTGSELFARRFFERYIESSGLPDYEALLANAGMQLRLANAGSTWAGPVSFDVDGKDVIIAGNTIMATPLYEAGLDRGDQVLAVDRLRITSQQRWDNALSRYEPGETATIRFLQRGVEKTADITFEEDPTVEVISYEAAGQDVSRDQRAFRDAWLDRR
jgi:predicted metalloprotease with PDZ domain